MNVIFIGAGNLATNLAHAMHEAGVPVLQVYSRTAESAKRLASLIGAPWTTSLSEVRRDAQVYIYALKDSVLRDVVEQIDAPTALHLHTAGSMAMDVFDRQTKPHAGVLYPFQSFSKQRLVDFRTLPIFLEARQEADYELINCLAAQISTEVYRADSHTRKRLHLAGVFANNFTNCMYRIGGEILAETGIPEKVLLNLIDETAAKVHTVSPRDAQTGPSKRWDENVMADHLSLLPDAQLQEIYRLISANIHAHA